MWTLTIQGENEDVPANVLTKTQPPLEVRVNRIVEELTHAGLTVTYVNLADEGTTDEDLFGTAPAS